MDQGVPKRRSWIRIVTLVCSGLAGVGYWYWSIARWPQGQIIDVRAVDEQRALLVRRPTDADATGVVLVLVDREAGPQWKRIVPGIGRGSLRSIAVHDAQITVRGPAPDGTTQTRAFAMADGALRWTSKANREPSRPQGPGLVYIDHLVDGERRYELRSQHPQVLAALELTSGRELWQHPLIPDPDPVVYRAWLRGDRLIIQYALHLELRDAPTGRVVGQAPIRHHAACVLDDAILYTAPDGTHHHLALPNLETTPLSTRLAPDDVTDTARLAGLCGRRGDTLVVTMAEQQTRFAIHGLDAATRALRWSIPLGPWDFDAVDSHAINNRYPDAVPLSGNLPRFVPVKVADRRFLEPGGRGSHREPALIVVDLDQHRVAWRSAATNALTNHDLFAHQGRFYLAQANTIGIIDGATGRLTRAARIIPAGTFLPDQFANDLLWVYIGDQYGTVDAQTFAPRQGRHARIRDYDLRPTFEKLLAPPSE